MLPVLLFASAASATELVWDGFYRGRALMYDSLSLSTENVNAEGVSTQFDHRLLLRPSWLISEHAAIHAEVDMFKLGVWGETPATYVDPVTGEEIAVAQADGITTSGSGLQGVRGWGEAYTQFGRISIGRMPMQWGAGLWWNDGTAADSEYGDTADRIQFTTKVGPVFVLAAWDVQYEGLIGDDDDVQSVSLAAGYRTETLGVGLLNNYRYPASDDGSFSAYTGDLWAFAELGPVRAELEAVGVFGGGDLDEGQNDVTVAAMGLMVRGDYRSEKLSFGAEFGVASGDDESSDSDLKTFSFDRDHNVALMLFEEPLPTLASAVATDANGGRTLDAARSGDAVSNAIYFRPAARYRLLDTLEAEAAWIVASRADSDGDDEAVEGYGNEIDVSVRWDPHPHVWFKGTVGFLLPGQLYTEYTDADLGGSFDSTAVGARVLGVVEF